MDNSNIPIVDSVKLVSPPIQLRCALDILDRRPACLNTGGMIKPRRQTLTAAFKDSKTAASS
jgi:hypothetical protein